jgi:hypothetical protein
MVTRFKEHALVGCSRGFESWERISSVSLSSVVSLVDLIEVICSLSEEDDSEEAAFASQTFICL